MTDLEDRPRCRGSRDLSRRALDRARFEQGEGASPTLSALRAYREHRAAGRRTSTVLKAPGAAGQRRLRCVRRRSCASPSSRHPEALGPPPLSLRSAVRGNFGVREPVDARGRSTTPPSSTSCRTTGRLASSSAASPDSKSSRWSCARRSWRPPATRRLGDDGEAVQAPLALFRMDFAARVRTPDGGERQVLIEIQKTNAPTVVERFRAYLGQQLCSPANVIEHPSGRREAAPIVTIYLLGYDLGLSDEAVLDVCPRATARRTGAEIDTGHPFIAGIHHRSHIVQISRLRGRRRDELQRVLSIFDQGEARIERGGAQVLTIDESAYPPEYGFVLRQLQRAASESDVRRFMEGEDQLLPIRSRGVGRRTTSGGRRSASGPRRSDAEQALSRSHPAASRSRAGAGRHRRSVVPGRGRRVRRVLAASDDGKGAA